jgi:hypothetical protein
MENVFELSYVGSPSGLMSYIRSNIPNCEICNDKGFYEKTEWSGTDDSYDVAVRCQCSED